MKNGALAFTSNQMYCGVAGWPAESNSRSSCWPASEADILNTVEGPWHWRHAQGVVCREDAAADGGQAGNGSI